jgi:hypothetical protein
MQVYAGTVYQFGDRRLGRCFWGGLERDFQVEIGKLAVRGGFEGVFVGEFGFLRAKNHARDTPLPLPPLVGLFFCFHSCLRPP